MEAVPPIPIALTVLEMVQYAENPWGLASGTGNVYNVGESGVWEELVDDFRVSREEVMNVKGRDGVRLRFNELVHMIFTGEGRDMSWEKHGSENASKKEVVQSGREVR